MTLKSLVLVTLGLMAIQALVIIGVTRANKAFFDGRPASRYSIAVKSLSRARPVAGAALKVSYGLFLVEIVALFVAKYAIHLQ